MGLEVGSIFPVLCWLWAKIHPEGQGWWAAGPFSAAVSTQPCHKRGLETCTCVTSPRRKLGLFAAPESSSPSPHQAPVHPGSVHLLPTFIQAATDRDRATQGPFLSCCWDTAVSDKTGPSLQGQAFQVVEAQRVWWVRCGRVAVCVWGSLRASQGGCHTGRWREPPNTAAILLDAGHVSLTLGASGLPQPKPRHVLSAEGIVPDRAPHQLTLPAGPVEAQRGPAAHTDGGVTACTPQASVSPGPTPTGLGRSSCCASSPAPGMPSGVTWIPYPQGSQLVGPEREGQL